MKPDTTWVQMRMIRNIFSNYFNFFWTVGLSILLTPFIVHRLGKNHYGIWILTMTIFGSLSYSELGIGLALVRAVVQDLSRQAFSEVRMNR